MVVLLAAAAVLAAGCASTVTGSAVVATGVTLSTSSTASSSTTATTTTRTTPSTRTSPSTAETSPTAGPTSTGSTALTGTPVDREQFLADLARANASVTSVRGALQVDGPSGLVATFDATQSGGTLDGYAMDMTVQVDGQEIPLSLLLVDRQLYLASDVLLPALGISTTWLLVDPASTDPTIAQLGDQFATVTDDLGAGQVDQLRAALREVVEVGPAELEGPDGTVLPVTHYQGLIDGSVLEVDGASGDVPMDLYLDEQGRVVHTVTTARVGGQTITSTVSIESYDDPIVITAPDPAEVTAR